MAKQLDRDLWPSSTVLVPDATLGLQAFEVQPDAAMMKLLPFAGMPVKFQDHTVFQGWLAVRPGALIAVDLIE